MSHFPEFAPKILKMGEIYTDSKMCWLEALPPEHMPMIQALLLLVMSPKMGIKNRFTSLEFPFLF